MSDPIQGSQSSNEDDNISWEEAFAEQALAESPAPRAGAPGQHAAQAHQAQELKPAAGAPGAKPLDIDFLLDIPLEVSVEIGRTKMPISDLLQLNQGSVIELEKLMGEPMEVLINDRLVARGEVVVVNERFGVRLTDIISPMERIAQLH